MYGNVGWEHPYSDVQCVLSRCSAGYAKNTKPPRMLVVQLFNSLRDYSRYVAPVKKPKKTKADEIVPELRLEKSITRSLPDNLKTAGTTLFCETKNTRLSTTTHTTHAYRAKPHHTVPPVCYTICANSSSKTILVLFCVVFRVLHVCVSGQRACATRKKKIIFPLEITRKKRKEKKKRAREHTRTHDLQLLEVGGSPLSYLCVHGTWYFNTIRTCNRNWFCVPVRYWELNMCAVLGWMGTKSHGNSTFSKGFGWVGTMGYDVRGYDLDGNGKRSFAWARFGWVRELRFITGPVPFPVPVEIPREKYRENIRERSLGNFSASSRSQTELR